MLIRLVRMTFRPETVPEFLEIFRESQPRIRAFPGCRHVELLRDLDQPHVYVTHSHWDDGAALDAYRQSELFRGTWAKTRLLFSERPVAYSLGAVEG